MLNVQKLQPLGYQQHTYTMIGIVYKYLSKCIHRIFISNNHWILVQVHASTPNLHYTIYDSNTLTKKKKKKWYHTIINKIINVRHLLYVICKYHAIVGWFILWAFYNIICNQYNIFTQPITIYLHCPKNAVAFPHKYRQQKHKSIFPTHSHVVECHY